MASFRFASTCRSRFFKHFKLKSPGALATAATVTTLAAVWGFATAGFAQEGAPPLSPSDAEALGLEPTSSTAPAAPQDAAATTTPGPAAAPTPEAEAQAAMERQNNSATSNEVRDALEHPPGSLPDATAPLEANAAEPSAPSINSIEAYEEYQKKAQAEARTPKWSVNILSEPLAFPTTNWRARPRDTLVDNAKFFGLILHAERFFIRHAGLASVGLEVGVFGTLPDEFYTKSFPAITTLSPTLAYQFNYTPGQVIVPYIQTGVSVARYYYAFNSALIQGFKVIPRLDLGGLFYLNVLDRSSSGDLFGNYGILRTYLSAAYTIAQDINHGKDMNLSERTLRIGLRFEF